MEDDSMNAYQPKIWMTTRDKDRVAVTGRRSGQISGQIWILCQKRDLEGSGSVSVWSMSRNMAEETRGSVGWTTMTAGAAHNRAMYQIK